MSPHTGGTPWPYAARAPRARPATRRRHPTCAGPGSRKRASSAATMRSHMHASIKPAAEHAPWTAATVGVGRSRIFTSLSKYMTCSWCNFPSSIWSNSGPMLLAGEQFLQVVTSREVLSFRGKHDHPHRIVGVGRRGLRRAVHQSCPRSGRWPPPGGRERDRGDRTVDSSAQGGERHAPRIVVVGRMTRTPFRPGLSSAGNW